MWALYRTPQQATGGWFRGVNSSVIRYVLAFLLQAYSIRLSLADNGAMTSNDLHKMLLDNLSTAVLLLDGDFLIGYINPAAEALLQASRGRLLGTPASELFSDHELSSIRL